MAQMPRPWVCASQWIDGAEDFLVLADKLLGAHGKKLLVERREFAAVNFGADDAAQPVARVHFSGAAIPDLIQKFHLSGVLLAHIAEIQTQDGIGLHAPAAEAQQSLCGDAFPILALANCARDGLRS